MKKISILVTFGLFFTLVEINMYANNSDQSNDDYEDFFEIDEQDLPTIPTEFIFEKQTTQVRGTPQENAANWGIVFSQLKNPSAFLNQPIYLHTCPIREREILTYPFALTYGFNIQKNSAVSAMFFMNSSSTKNFTKKSQYLDSYLDFNNKSRFAEIQEFINATGTEFNILNTLKLFSPAKVTENRIGGLLQGHVVRKKCTVNLQIPVLYTERNLFLTKQEEAAIGASPLGALWKSDSNEDGDLYKRKHFAADQFGIGDLKIKAMYELHRSETFDVDFGGFVILPTATSLTQGMYCGWFPINNERTYFNIATIDPLAGSLTPANKVELANYVQDIFAKLFSNILNCPLGNNGHVTLATSANMDWKFMPNWMWSSDYSIQVPLPAQEQRFYNIITTPGQFAVAYNAATAAYNADPSDPWPLVNLANTQLQNMFFPVVFPTMVFPGTVLNSTNRFIYTRNTWDFHLGSNFWYQGREYLHLNSNKIANQNITEYDIPAATAANAYQSKVLGAIYCNLDKPNHSWSFSLYGDMTLWNYGMGNDFTLGLNLDCKF